MTWMIAGVTLNFSLTSVHLIACYKTETKVMIKLWSIRTKLNTRNPCIRTHSKLYRFEWKSVELCQFVTDWSRVLYKFV